jgi:hypothetical protein
MAPPTPEAFQDHYAADVAHCYGCGRLNPSGHQLKTRWDGEETVTRFTPQPHHTAVPGYVYGGLIASLVDCHGTGTAAAVALTGSPDAGGGDRPATTCGPRPSARSSRSAAARGRSAGAKSWWRCVCSRTAR